MARAGADVLIPHMGLTTKGSIGAKTAMTLPEAARRVQSLCDAAREVNPDIQVLQVSAETGQAMEAWYQWLRRELAGQPTLASS